MRNSIAIIGGWFITTVVCVAMDSITWDKRADENINYIDDVNKIKFF